MKEIQTKAGKILINQFGKMPTNTPAPEADATKTYKILGRLSELTDKDCEEFVKKMPFSFSDRYYKYVPYMYSPEYVKSAKKSFISLLQSQGVDTSKEWLIIKIL